MTFHTRVLLLTVNNINKLNTRFSQLQEKDKLPYLASRTGKNNRHRKRHTSQSLYPFCCQISLSRSPQNHGCFRVQPQSWALRAASHREKNMTLHKKFRKAKYEFYLDSTKSIFNTLISQKASTSNSTQGTLQNLSFIDDGFHWIIHQPTAAKGFSCTHDQDCSGQQAAPAGLSVTLSEHCRCPSWCWPALAPSPATLGQAQKTQGNPRPNQLIAHLWKATSWGQAARRCHTQGTFGAPFLITLTTPALFSCFAIHSKEPRIYFFFSKLLLLWL